MQGSSNSASGAVTPLSLLTDGNVRAALTADKGANAQLTDWKIVNFTKVGDNYACVVTSVEVKYELNGRGSEVSYVVKLSPCTNDPSTALINDIVFEKEAKFYLDLVPELNHMLKENGQREINFPKCFNANLEKRKEVLFLEDLRSRGYKMFDRKLGLDEAHASLVLRELARLHAASILLQKKHPVEELPEKYPCLKKDFAFLMANSSMPLVMVRNSLKFAQVILKKVGGYDRAIVWIDTLIPRLVNIFNEQMKGGEPLVVCHGDCWNNNLLFRYDKAGHPVDVMLLDLQMVRYGSPASELQLFLYTSTTGETRKPNLQAFLNCYHEALTDVMKAAGAAVPFTREQLLKDFRDTYIIGGIYGMLSVPIVMLQTDDAAPDSSKGSDESVQEKMAKVRARALATLDTNPLLKPRFLSIFDDMMEVGIIP